MHNVQRIALGTDIHTAEWLMTTYAGQFLLSAVHRKAERPRCMCVAGGIEMYVGKRGRIYYLSRMPGTGFLHAENCASVEDSTIFSGAQCYASGAIVEHIDGSLSVNANLNRRHRQASPLTEVGIDGLLALMIEQADINRLISTDAGKTWASVRNLLLNAAGLIRVGNRPLTDFLYLPERYERERSVSMLASCEAFVEAMDGQALLCAPLKDIRQTSYGWQLVLKHLPGLRLWASSEVAMELEGRWQNPLFSAPPPFSLCLVMTKPGRRHGNYTVINAAFLPTNANYFPCCTEREAAVAEELRHQGHDLLRPLRFDIDPTIALADFCILKGDPPEPVFVMAPSGNDALDAAKRLLVGLMQRNQARVLTL